MEVRSGRRQLAGGACRQIGISVGQDVQDLRIMRKLPAQHAQEVLQGVQLLQSGRATHTIQADSLLQFLVCDVRRCFCQDRQGLDAMTALRQRRGMFGGSGSDGSRALPEPAPERWAHDAK